MYTHTFDPTRKPNLSSIYHYQSSTLLPPQDQSLKVVAAAATQTTTIHFYKDNWSIICK